MSTTRHKVDIRSKIRLNGLNVTLRWKASGKPGQFTLINACQFTLINARQFTLINTGQLTLIKA